MPRSPALKPANSASADEYSTDAIETHPDMWTARISRTELVAGKPRTLSAYVNVGSISHLIAVAENEKQDAQE